MERQRLGAEHDDVVKRLQTERLVLPIAPGPIAIPSPRPAIALKSPAGSGSAVGGGRNRPPGPKSPADFPPAAEEQRLVHPPGPLPMGVRSTDVQRRCGEPSQVTQNRRDPKQGRQHDQPARARLRQRRSMPPDQPRGQQAVQKKCRGQKHNPPREIIFDERQAVRHVFHPEKIRAEHESRMIHEAGVDGVEQEIKPRESRRPPTGPQKFTTRADRAKQINRRRIHTDWHTRGIPEDDRVKRRQFERAPARISTTA